MNGTSGLGRGLIDRISAAGVERAELAHNTKAVVGGARIPYTPRDLASILTIISPLNPKRYLALEVAAKGGIEFIGRTVGGMYLHGIDNFNHTALALLKHLKKLRQAFDIITIDGRGLKLDAATLWLCMEGGKVPIISEVGRNAHADYGRAKMKTGTVIILNLAEPKTKELYYRLRNKLTPLYSSPFVGVVRV